MGTTDLHSNVVNWDYFADAEYADALGNQVGIAKIAAMVGGIRAERGRASTLLIDAGDTIQGTPLAYYRANVAPIDGSVIHPMAAAMNHIGYDAAALGNHEFNYGIDILRTFESQLDFPLLGANVIDEATGYPAFAAYAIFDVHPIGAPRAVRVGVLGVTTPGAAVWDREYVGGVLRFDGIVETAKDRVPAIRAAGAEIVIICAHSGATTSSSYGDALPFPENASALLAEEVPGVDAILVGHAHVEIAERFVHNTQTGREVLLTEPLCWGMRLALIDIEVQLVGDRYEVCRIGSQLLNSNTAPQDPGVVEIVRPDHLATIEYVRSVIGECTEAMSLERATTATTAAIGFINHVQAAAVHAVISRTEYADLAVLSVASPFGALGAIPSGSVTIGDVASIYTFDNFLQALVFTGAELRDHLEHASRFFRCATSPSDDPAALIHATHEGAPDGMPDYDYDIATGLDAPLTYDIDLAQLPGARITHLRYDGRAVRPADRFVVAMNNYRAAGSANYPHTAGRQPIYYRRHEVRQLIVDWVRCHKIIDAAAFGRLNWRLVYDGTLLGRGGTTDT